MRLLLLAALLAPSLLPQVISFRRPANIYESGFSTVSTTCANCLAIADFNADGRPDVVFTFTLQTPFTAILLGKGDGAFGDPDFISFPATSADRVLTGDFNADKKTDILFYDGSGYLPVLGNGDGTFAKPGPRRPWELTTGSAGPIFIADLDRDGNPDFVYANGTYLGNGDATFRRVGIVDATWEAVPLAIGDLNADNAPDMIFQTLPGQLAIVLNRGDGSFAPPAPFAHPFDLSNGILLADFTADGLPDLVGKGARSELIVLPGTRNGAFGTPLRTSIAAAEPYMLLSPPNINPVLASQGNFSLLAAADFNRDGRIDLLAGTTVFPGRGDGSFGFPVLFNPIARVCAPDVAPGVPARCDATPVTAAVADLNADAAPDLVYSAIWQGANPGRTGATVSISSLLNNSAPRGLTATGVSSATFRWPVAPGSIVSAFGVGLAARTEAAAASALPTTLAGIRVHLWDGRNGDTLAPLLFASPSQVNFVNSSGQPFPFIAIERIGEPFVEQATAIRAVPLAPGFYTSPQGQPLGNIITLDAGGIQTARLLTECTAAACTQAPINVSQGDVYIALYGTGFASARTEDATCSLSGRTIPAAFAGSQRQFPGLDQLNLRLPPDLAGAGTVSLTCSFGPFASGSQSNTVPLAIR